MVVASCSTALLAEPKCCCSTAVVFGAGGGELRGSVPDSGIVSGGVLSADAGGAGVEIEVGIGFGVAGSPISSASSLDVCDEGCGPALALWRGLL